MDTLRKSVSIQSRWNISAHMCDAQLILIFPPVVYLLREGIWLKSNGRPLFWRQEYQECIVAMLGYRPDPRCCTFLIFTRGARDASPPNILLIVLDDLGYNDLGVNVNSETPTPNLNALAAQGARYTAFLCGFNLFRGPGSTIDWSISCIPWAQTKSPRAIGGYYNHCQRCFRLLPFFRAFNRWSVAIYPGKLAGSHPE